MFPDALLHRAVTLRGSLRTSGLFKEADRIRAWLTAHGIRVEDYRCGSIWVRDDPWALKRDEPAGELEALLKEVEDGRSVLSAPD